MDYIKYFREKKGFIAALDQSGGSSKKTLINYGILETDIKNDEVMFDYIHEMRARIICNPAFTNDYILGVILFRQTMEKTVQGINTIKYLNNKNIPAFLKIDVGLDELSEGVQLLNFIPDLDEILDKAKDYGVAGTKMRSLIKEYNEFGIKIAVEQQFGLAKKVIAKGLIPIIEPEVDINAVNKKNIESFLKKEIIKQLEKMDKEDYVILKLSIPSIPNFYDSFLNFKNVLRIVALSGGYEQELACNLLKNNKHMIASFSRAFLEGLKVEQTSDEFENVLKNNILKIYDASVNKN